MSRDVCLELGKGENKSLNQLRKNSDDPWPLVNGWRERAMRTGSTQELIWAASQYSPRNRKWLIGQIHEMDLLGSSVKKMLIDAINGRES